MKSKEELNALKEEVETLSRKLHELTDGELEQVSGGFTDHGDGTYSFVHGDGFRYVLGNETVDYTVLGNYDHLTLDDWVLCEYIHERDGAVFNMTCTQYQVKQIIHIY